MPLIIFVQNDRTKGDFGEKKTVYKIVYIYEALDKKRKLCKFTLLYISISHLILYRRDRVLHLISLLRFECIGINAL